MERIDISDNVETLCNWSFRSYAVVSTSNRTVTWGQPPKKPVKHRKAWMGDVGAVNPRAPCVWSYYLLTGKGLESGWEGSANKKSQGKKLIHNGEFTWWIMAVIGRLTDLGPKQNRQSTKLSHKHHHKYSTSTFHVLENVRRRGILSVDAPIRNILQLIYHEKSTLARLKQKRYILWSEVIDNACRGIILFCECKYSGDAWMPEQIKWMSAQDPTALLTNSRIKVGHNCRQGDHYQLYSFSAVAPLDLENQHCRLWSNSMDSTFCGSSGSSVGWGHRTLVPSLVNLSLEATASPNSILASLWEI
jgi:hypothetical protein